MLESILLDYEYTIVNLVTNERLLLAVYRSAIASLAEYGTAAGFADAAMVIARLETQIDAAFEANALGELDLIAQVPAYWLTAGTPFLDQLLQGISGQVHRAIVDETYLPPEHAQILQRLQAEGFRLGLLSQTCLPRDVFLSDLDNLALLEYFEVVTITSGIGVQKPAPAVFLTAARMLACAPGATLFVGDDLHLDIAGASAAGMPTVLTQQYRRATPVTGTVAPTAIIQRLSELPAVAHRLSEGYQ